jgi:hypothetical protein
LYIPLYGTIKYKEDCIMTEFVGTVVVLALGVALGYGLTWLVAYRMIDSDWGKKIIKNVTSKIMEFAKEEMPKMQKQIEEIINESIPKDE